MGFGQGPGQANNFGTVYENQYGFVGGQSFALSIASLGFVWACIPGVIYMNILRKKGKLATREADPYQGDVDLIEMKGTKDELPLTESMDKLTMQVSIVMLVFAVTFGFMFGIDRLLIDNGTLGNFGYNTLRPLIWGFNFIFGTIFAIGIRKLIEGLHKKGVMKRNYLSNFMLNRIAGIVFDFMIIASIMAIDIEMLNDLWVPFLIVTTAGGFGTFYFLKIIAKTFYAGYEIPGFMAMFGTMTGTASTGVALLREVDPDFSTPASDNLVSGSVGAMVFGFPVMLLMSLGPKRPGLTLIILVAFFGFLLVLLYRHQIFGRKRKAQEQDKTIKNG